MKQLESRKELLLAGEADWALGEALAFGSLLLDGHDVRMAGQDSRRGTFSHRHAALIDYRTGENYVPLENIERFLGPDQGSKTVGRFMLYDSLLSEYAALGFEYGYSTIRKDALVIWEAQFGDFANGGQIVIDQFLAAAHDKWDQSSGLVMLLPHGYEGQGPEHSSGRLERFLQSCAGENMAVMNLTNSAQYFHMLRAQPKRSKPRPVILFSPKSLLRAKTSRVPIDELVNGSFVPVLDDPSMSNVDTGPGYDAEQVKRIILCSGKVAFDAIARRDQLMSLNSKSDLGVVVRVEQLYPWPVDDLRRIFMKYKNAAEVVWLQEEPENQGSWTFVHSQLHDLLGESFRLRPVSRVAAGSPATGSAAMHALEQADLLYRAVEWKVQDAQALRMH